MEFLLSHHPMALILRENFVFKIIPMVNPDGVFLGNNRCNLVGQDLNRCWNVSSEFSSPTILAIKELLKEIDNSDVRFGELLLAYHHIKSLSRLVLSNRFRYRFPCAYDTEWIVHLR